MLWRLVKFLLLLIILSGIALVIYAYVGPLFFQRILPRLRRLSPANHVGPELMRYFGPVLLLCLSGHALAAQQAKPLSAIDWLSQSVEAPLVAPAPAAKPKVDELPVATGANVPQVTVTSLDGPSPDPVGLLSSAVTGLPVAFGQKARVRRWYH